MFAVMLVVGPGCAGRASIEIVPLGFRAINPQAPLSVRFRPERCYYWIDEHDQVCVSFLSGRATAAGDHSRRALAMSLVFDGRPADHGRDYRATSRTVRGIWHDGMNHLRFASLHGIASLSPDGRDRMRGVFRIALKQQAFHVLTGWSTNAGVLLIGRFEAVRDPRRGRAILEATERDGLERPPPGVPPPGTPRPVTGPPIKQDHAP